MMKCSKCGADLEQDAKFCPSCGNQVGAPVVEKKKNNVLIIVIVLILFLLLLGGGGFALYHHFAVDNSASEKTDKKETKEEKKEEKETTKPAPENIDLSTIKEIKADNDDTPRNSKFELLNSFYSKGKYSSYAKTYFLIKNNNTEMLSVTVYLNFYKNGVRVDSKQGHVSNLKGNTEFVANMSFDTIEDYDSIDLTVNTKLASSYYIDVPIKKEDIQVNRMDEGSLATIVGIYKNNTQKEMVLYALCKYYKDNKVVFASNTIATPKAGASGELKFYDSSLPEGVEYDKYEIIPYSAYYQDDNY